MEFWTTVQGVIAAAGIVALTLGLRHAGDALARRDEPDRHVVLARVARAWAEIVRAHEVAAERLRHDAERPETVTPTSVPGRGDDRDPRAHDVAVRSDEGDRSAW